MRISRHSMFMQMAHVASQRSTCMRLNVGAIVVAERNVLSIGYNGPPAGEPHCSGADCCAATGGVCKRATHAEINAIRRIPWHSVTKVAELYVTDSPCVHCMEEIVRLGTIRKLYYDRVYRISDHLSASPLEVYRVTPNGMLVDHRTKALIDD